MKAFRALLILLAIAVVLPRFEVSAEPICPDKRERMECGHGSEIAQTGNLIVSLRLKLKKLFDVSGSVEKQKQTKVDEILERFKEINKTTCSMWNACLDEELWREFYTQFTEVLLQGDRITRQKGVDDQKVQNFIVDMEDLTKFYERGISDDYKKVQSN